MVNWLRAVITGLFILSGLTSLVYETLWIRVLSLGIGSTSASISMVLSIFFLGLAVGSYFSGKLCRRFLRPLRVYGIIEGSIGLYSFALIHILLEFPTVMNWMPVSGSLTWLAFFIKFVLVFLFLIVPTVGMGATLPLLVRILSQKNHGVGKNVSWLYTVNTVGAVLGAFSTGYFFIPLMGVIWTNHTMVMLNLLIFVICWNLPVMAEVDGEDKAADKFEDEKLSASETSGLQARKIFVVCGLVGFSSIGAEVIWNKYLAIFFGSNIFGLSLILSIFLFGIALGSFLLSRFVDRIKDEAKFLVAMLTLTVVAIVGASQLLNVSPILANIAGYYFPQVSFLVIKSSLAFLILVIPTCLFGSLLPLLINLLTTSNRQAPLATGLAYAANTVGGILGSASAGLWFIPQFSSESTLKILCLVMVLAFGLSMSIAPVKKTYAAIGTTFLAAIVFFGPSIQFKNIIKSASYSWPDPNLPFQDVMAFFAKNYEEIHFLHEGKTAIISLNNEMDNDTPLKDQFRLKTNGLNESYYDMTNLSTPPKFEALLGLLPYLFFENPQNAFIVGYGGGYTVDVLTSFEIPDVHVAELEEGILKAADFIHRGDNPILKRKNLYLQIEDARFVLNAKRNGPYDIIVSQPSHSWLSGVANLFTLEFFETVKDNLTSGGIYSQWLNLYNIDEASLKSILRTFYTSFPHGAVFTDRGEGEMIMLGSNLPLNLRQNKLNEMIKDPSWRQTLHKVPFDTSFDLITNYLMSRSTVLRMTDGSPLNTDINAYAEIRQSSVFYSTNSQQETVQPLLSEYFDGDYTSIIPGFETTDMEFMESLIHSLGRQQKYEKYLALLKEFEKNTATDPRSHESLAQLCYDVERMACAQKYGELSLARQVTIEKLNFLMAVNEEIKEFKAIIDLYEKHRKTADRQSECLVLNAYLQTGQYDRIGKLVDKIHQNYNDYLAACDSSLTRTLGDYYLEVGDPQNASVYLNSFIASFPGDLSGLSLAIRANLASHQWSSANADAVEFADILHSEIDRLETLAKHYRGMKWHEDAEFLERKLRVLKK